jgi:hypothetical protein
MGAAPLRGSLNKCFPATLFFLLCVSCALLSPRWGGWRRAHAAPFSSLLARGSARARPQPALLPFVDIVIVMPVPWARVEMMPAVPGAVASARDVGRSRRANAYLAFQRMRAATNATAHLLFVLGGPAPGPLSVEDAAIFGDPAVTALSAPCADIDNVPWPGAEWAEFFHPANSSTTCKVLHGAAHAAAAFRFRYFAKCDSDAILRWPYFLEHVAPMLPSEGLVFGNIDWKTMTVPPHLVGVFGAGRFPHYPSGMGYILSPDVVRYLGAPLTGPRFVTAGPEDATIGHILAPLAANPVHSDHFINADQGCGPSTVLLHYVSDAHSDSIDAHGVIHCV